MFPVVDTNKPDRDELLGRLWDALQESGTLGSDEIESEDVEVITGLHRAEDVPPADEDTIQHMWGVIDAGLSHSTLSVANGSAQYQLATLEAIPVALTRSERVAKSVQPFVRTCAVAVASGFLLGFLVLGGGGRIAMRLAAMMSADELQGATTENFETVGEVTLSGSFNLMMTGGFFGISLGLGFALIAPLLPRSGWRRILISGFVFFAVCGFVTLEAGENGDYERFGIVGVNICLFTLLPLIFGLLIAPTFDRIDKRIPRDAPHSTYSMKGMVLSLSLWAVMLPAFAGFLTLLFLPPMQLFLAAPVLATAGTWLANRHTTVPVKSPSWASRLALALPSLAGLLLTLLAIERIV